MTARHPFAEECSAKLAADIATRKAELTEPLRLMTRAELDERDDRIYARDLIRERQSRYGG